MFKIIDYLSKKKVLFVNKPFISFFIYISEKRKLNLQSIELNNLYFIKNYKSFSPYGLYDFKKV